MLGKVLKYDITADYKKIAAVCAGLILIGLLNRAAVSLIIGRTDTILSERTELILSYIDGIHWVAVTLLIAIGIGMIANIFTGKFVKGFLGDEGYLLNTLPVKMWQHLLSKLIVTYIFMFLLYFALEINLSVYTNEVFPLTSFVYDYAVKPIVTFDDLNTVVFIAAMIAIAPFSMLSVTFLGFSIGNLFGKTNSSISYITMLGAYVIILIATYLPVSESRYFEFESVKEVIFAMNTSIALHFAFPVIYYIAANIIFTKKLNLE